MLHILRTQKNGSPFTEKKLKLIKYIKSTRTDQPKLKAQIHQAQVKTNIKENRASY